MIHRHGYYDDDNEYAAAVDHDNKYCCYSCCYYYDYVRIALQLLFSACINRPADVYFVLDSSSSIWVNDFEVSMLGFVRDVIDIFDVGSSRTRVGIITFSDNPRTVFGLGSHVHKDELLKVCY